MDIRRPHMSTRNIVYTAPPPAFPEPSTEPDTEDDDRSDSTATQVLPPLLYSLSRLTASRTCVLCSSGVRGRL